MKLIVADYATQVVRNGADALRDDLDRDRAISLYVMGQHLKLLRGEL